MNARTLTAVLAVATTVACTRANPAYDPNPALPDECRSGEETTEKFANFADPDKLDVLFVVDASNDDPVALQELFANAVTPIGGLLEELEIDARFAVATTDASASGLSVGVTGPDCGNNDVAVAELGKNGWDEALRCNLFAAPSAEAYDQPLAVVSDLLANPPDDFLREDARLLVVIATLRDDCSAAGALSGAPGPACAEAELVAVDELVDGWADTHPTLDPPGLLVFAGPASDLAADAGRPVCSSTIGQAYAGNRLFAASQRMEFGQFHTICTDDIRRPLRDALRVFTLEGTVAVCPAEPLAHEPLAVLADGDPVSLGDDGFVFLNTTSSCANGAIRFATSALTGVDEVEVTYCTVGAE